MAEKPAGKVEHYYPKVQAAAVRLTKKVKLGDEVHIVGHGDDVKEKVTSLQLDHQPIEEGQPGQSVGLWVKDRVHEGDDVLLVTPDAKPNARSAAKPKARKAKAAKAGKSAKAARRPKRAKAARKAPRKAARRKPAARRSAKPKRGAKRARSGKAASRKSARKASRKRR